MDQLVFDMQQDAVFLSYTELFFGLKEMKNTTKWNIEVTTTTTQIENFQTQLTERRSTLKSLMNEYQSHLAMKKNWVTNVADTERHYAAMLAQIQQNIEKIEAELWQVRKHMEQQNMIYTKLEEEITTYRRLLEEEESRTAIPEVEKEDPDRVVRAKLLVEEVQDGEVIAFKVEDLGELKVPVEE